MEMYARVVHRWAWHEFVPGWSIHRSHHEPRTGAFELNDLYAIVRIEFDRLTALVLLRSHSRDVLLCSMVRLFAR